MVVLFGLWPTRLGSTVSHSATLSLLHTAFALPQHEVVDFDYSLKASSCDEHPLMHFLRFQREIYSRFAKS